MRRCACRARRGHLTNTVMSWEVASSQHSVSFSCEQLSCFVQLKLSCLGLIKLIYPPTPTPFQNHFHVLARNLCNNMQYATDTFYFDFKLENMLIAECCSCSVFWIIFTLMSDKSITRKLTSVSSKP